MNLLNVFKSHVISSNLFSLFQVQLHQWKDNGDKKSEYIVFQNNGGTPIRDGLSSESYIIISIIGSAQSGYSVATKANELIEFVKKNAITEFGYIENIGGVPGPIFTSDNRMTMQLQFRIVHDN
ncbi:hypothetical protein NM952_11600 [Pasteurella multocida subsp. multocida]|uniref:phage tail termination protein n=2 Tax=Pasteurella multocida TaxID=747 RepID=UPI00086F216A|nr:hypothetical protein [Pasteurella multocida]MDA5608718.1 hypothetical protein [Pasteurella multocida subsp. multocida]MDA5616253.1 hypothetical protein [Pasteurella multocida]MDA5619231.1 hypothetical protein [Pasteurella multocida subsp. multocida]MDA5626303.1 hypothetical protein [Pasteurella multocida]MRN36580.1 hypothetical protein [Pasteurella multocida]